MTTTVITTLTHIVCCKCGLVFGIETGYLDGLLESHENFYCPNGHSQRFLSQTEKERRIAELERQAKALVTARDYWVERHKSASAQAAHKERQVNGYKGVVTRMKRRAVAGRCPCCSHKFADLERHMKAKHPKFDPDRAAAALSEKPTAPA